MKKLEPCPYCGSEILELMYTCKGRSSYYYDIDPEKQAENGDMYEGIEMIPHKNIYCGECKKYRGKAEELLKGRSGW